MLTHAEALEKSRAIWGDTIGAPRFEGEAWLCSFPGDSTIHRLDLAGRVICGHPDCYAKERLAVSDAIASRRLRLRRVLSARLGMPDRFEVSDSAGRTLATVIATEDAIEIIASARGFVATAPPAAAGRLLRLTFLA
jgi:hypothetical protein